MSDVPQDSIFCTCLLIITAFLLITIPLSISHTSCNKTQVCNKNPSGMSVDEQNNAKSSKNCGGCNNLTVPIAKGVCMLIGIGILVYVSYSRMTERWE